MSRKYLLVDDNRAFSENVAEILAATGAEVCLAAGGDEALEQVKHQRFDVVVTDMRMPGRSGAELVRLLRDLDPGVPVVLLSAFAQDAQLHEARRFGLLAFLTKASSTGRLLSLVAQARRDATVVLVEKDGALLEQLAEALSTRGFTTCAATSTEELAQLEVRPLVALVDVGHTSETIDLDSVRSRFPNTPIIAISGHPGSAPARARQVILTPFDTGTLVAQVEALASNHSESSA